MRHFNALLSEQQRSRNAGKKQRNAAEILGFGFDSPSRQFIFNALN